VEEGHEYGVAEELEIVLQQWETGNVHVRTCNGAESPVEVQQRSLPLVHQLLQYEDVKNLLIVCHGRLLKILICGLLKIGLENMAKLPQSNTAVNILDYNTQTGTSSVVILNCTKHLDNLSNKS